MAVERRFLAGFQEEPTDDPGIVLTEDATVMIVESDGERIPFGGGIPVLPTSDEIPQTVPSLTYAKQWVTVSEFQFGERVWWRACGENATAIDPIGLLAYVARVLGPAGNDLRIEYVLADPGDPLSVAVTGEEFDATITVRLEATPAAPTYARAVSSCPNDDSNLVFTAKEIGIGGNDISVRYGATFAANPTTVATLDGNEVGVALESEDQGEPQAIVWVTADNDPEPFVPAFQMEATFAGNSPRLQFKPESVLGGHTIGDVTVAVVGSFTQITLYIDNHVSTAQQCVDWINGFPAAAALVTATTIKATGIIQDFGSYGTFTAGTSEYVPVATASDVLAAIEADPACDALVAVSFAPSEDGSGIVCDDAQWNLAGGGGAFAAVTTGLADVDANLTFTAQQAGTDGNEIGVTYAEDEVPAAETTAHVDGNEIVVDLEQTGYSQASATTTTGGESDVTFTAVVRGAGGNSAHIRMILDDAIADDIVLYSFVVAPTYNFQIRFKTGQTADDLIAWIATNPMSSGNVYDFNEIITTVLAPGSDGSGALASWGDDGTVLAGGADVTTSLATALDVQAAIEADPGASSSVAVSLAPGSDGTALVDFGSWALEGGEDGGIVITQSAQVKTAIEALPAAAALVSVRLLELSDSEDTASFSLGGGQPCEEGNTLTHVRSLD